MRMHFAHPAFAMAPCAFRIRTQHDAISEIREEASRENEDGSLATTTPLGFCPASDILAVCALVGLNILEPAGLASGGVQLLAGLAPMSRSLGSHDQTPPDTTQ